MLGLRIFLVIAFAACLFLAYVLGAFWRELHPGARARVQIKKLPFKRSRGNGKLFVISKATSISKAGKTG